MLPAPVRVLLALAVIALAVLAASPSPAFAKGCGGFKKRIDSTTTFVVRVSTKGRVPCRAARHMVKHFWFRRGVVRHGGPYSYNTWYTLKHFPGWRCGTGAGGGACSKRARWVYYSIR